MWYHERLLEKDKQYKLIDCLNVPQGYDVQYIDIDYLDPITKIQEETFYQFVRKSIAQWKVLFNPLVVHPISLEDWKKELEMDKDQTPPRKRENNQHLRIQCGCNRYYALRDLGYTALPCIIEPDLKKAQDVAHVLRIDRRWQRGSNMKTMIEEQKIEIN